MHTIVTNTAIKRFELYVVNQRKLMISHGEKLTTLLESVQMYG